MKTREKTLSIVIPIGERRNLYALESIKRQKIDNEVIIEKGPNPSQNRNRAIKKSKGKFIAFINAHTILTDNWSERVIEFFDKYSEIDIVGGPQLTHPKESYFGRLSSYALSSIFGVGGVIKRYTRKQIKFDANEKDLTSANLICRRKVIEKIKFDERLWPGEDPKFISDAKRSGFKVAFSPDLWIYHKRRSSVRDFAEQIFNYGKTRPQKERLLEIFKNPSFLVPSLFVLYLSLFTILSLINLIFLIPILLYLLLLVFFSCVESIKNRDLRSLLLLPIIFFTIHISYGLGFIYGVLTKVVDEKR